MRSRTTTFAAITVSASLVLTACTGDDQEATGEQTGTTEDPITLRFQSLAWQEDSIEANRRIVEEWNEQNPDIQVQYVQGDWGSVHDQLLTSFEGGDPPCVIHYEAAASQVFAEGGYFADLEGVLSDEFTSGIPQDIWSTVQYEDRGTVGVPFLLESRIPFANRTILEEAGIEIPTVDDPWTWDEFQDVSEQLTVDGRYGLAWPLASPTQTILDLSMSFGGDYVEQEGGDVEVVVEDEELAVPTRIHEMTYETESIDPASVGVSAPDALPAFFAGNTAMLFGAIWLRQQMVQQAPDDFDWVTLPPLVGSEGSTQSANPQTLHVAEQCEQQQAAAQFIEFFLNDENMAELAMGDWLVPTSEAALEVLTEKTNGEQGWDVAVASMESATAAPWQQAAGFQEWKDRTATPAFQRYLANEISAEELAQQLEEGGSVVGR